MNMAFSLVVLTVLTFIAGSLQTEKFPYVVRICKDSASLKCSGILIARNLVLTSGYCVYNTTEVRVYVGTTEDLCSTDNINDNRTIKSSVFFKAPNFNIRVLHPWVFSNELALILLPKAVKLSATVKVAALSEKPLDKLAGEKVLISGWGLKIDLQYSTSTIQRDQECTELFGMVFARIQQGCGQVEKYLDIYYLEPGSPLDYNGKIIGFKTNYPTDLKNERAVLFVNIYKYLPFIRDVQKKHPVSASGYRMQNSWMLLVIVQVLSMYIFKFIVL